jgi:hypothetical protein
MCSRQERKTSKPKELNEPDPNLKFPDGGLHYDESKPFKFQEFNFRRYHFGV